MQKAFKFLDKNKILYKFHNYKTEGIDKETLLNWLNQFPVDKLINTKSTTFKNLSDVEKASISNHTKAISLIIKQPSMLKRPLLDLENGTLLLGFNEPQWQTLCII